MDNNNNLNNQRGAGDKTRSFTNTEKLAQGIRNNGEVRVDTSANIRKAAVKRAVKKGAGITLFTLKKVLQWTFNVILTLLLVGLICGIIIGVTFGTYIKNDLADDSFDINITDLRQDLNATSWIHYDPMYVDENGNPYESVEIYGTENRKWITYEEMPEDLVNAFIAIEDERYWTHEGVDWKRTGGAVLSFITGSDDYGGSTITQQLIKNVTGEDETSIQRKVTEITRALTLSKKRTKEEVLEMYLNRIHLSRSNYGVWAAAKYYFGKDIAEGDELTLVECAALASIPKSPTKYDPVRNPEFNKERRHLVLKKMLELGWITQEEFDEADGQDLVLNITYEESQTLDKYSYFTDALIEQIAADLQKKYPDKYPTRSEAINFVYTGGLEIYSTENPKIQRAMEEVFEDESTFVKVDDGVQPQSAMVVMDPYSGYVLGIVGGRGEKGGRLDLNRATMSKRQVGSSIKPLTVYAPAMDMGIIDSFEILDDTPIYMESMGKYWPSNSPNRYFGKISVNEAIIRSKNTTAVKLVMEMSDRIGIEGLFNYAKNDLHLNSLVEADKNIAPLALGGFTNGLTVMEMTAAYSIFPNGGKYSSPKLYTRVLTHDGLVLLDTSEDSYSTSAISSETATIMTKMLENVVWSGTAAKIQLKYKVNVAGKTGSTNDNKDVYFCGFTPYYVGACWFGYDIPKDLTKFGTNQAMVAWEKVMAKIHEPILEDVKNGETQLMTFDYSKLKTYEYCLDSGKAPGDLCKLDPRGSRIGTGYYVEGQRPPSGTCDVHVLVEWCPESNMIANEYCPRITAKSLIIEESRSFMHGDVAIEDSIYTYRFVGHIPYEEIPDTPPFYQNYLAEGEKTGYAKYEAGAPVNAMCKVHGPHTLLEPEIPEEEMEADTEEVPEETSSENTDGSTEAQTPTDNDVSQTVEETSQPEV